MMTLETQPKTREEILKFLLSPIDDIKHFIDSSETCIRVIGALRCAGVQYIGQALVFTKEQLLEMGNFGITSYQLFERILALQGLKVGAFKDQFDSLSINSASSQKTLDFRSFENSIDENGEHIQSQIRKAIENIWDGQDVFVAQFKIPLTSGPMSKIGVSREFIAAVLSTPEVKDAFLKVAAGFVLAAQHPEHEVSINSTSENDGGPQ